MMCRAVPCRAVRCCAVPCNKIDTIWVSAETLRGTKGVPKKGF